MKIDFNRLDDLNARMTIVIEHADYAPALAENIKKYSKKLAIKGFRSGKTPKSVLTKMYGKGMLEETVSNMLNERLFGYLDENKIEFFGSPVMTENAEPVQFDIKSEKDYTFVFDIGLKPGFEFQYGNEEPLDIEVPAVDQEEIDIDIVRYRRLFGEPLPLTEGNITAFDRVGISLQRIPEGGTPEEESRNAEVDLERVKGDAISVLPGLSIGSTLEVNLESFYGYERSMVIKNVLELEEDPTPEAPLHYLLTVKSIDRPQTEPLTGEQLTRFTGKEMQDEAEFRAFLEKRVQDENITQANDMKKMRVRQTLLANNPFELPETFLIRWINQQREKKVEAGSRDADHFFRDTKWSLLLNRIATQENLEVTERDVQKQVTQWIIQNVNYQQTDIRKLMKRLHENEYFMSSMKENALEDVVFAHLIPQYQFTEKEVPISEFEKAFHDIHHQLFDHGDHDHHDHHDHHSHGHEREASEHSGSDEHSHS